MPPFAAPNPYGSYFNFYEVEAMARSSFLPNMGGGPSPGVSAAMGQPQGGMNPTFAEFQHMRYRDLAYQQYLSRAINNDPRAVSFGNMTLQAMYGSDDKSKQDTLRRLGGRSNFNEMIGFMMGMPGVSAFVGGSPRSMPLGAAAMATGGLTMTDFQNRGQRSMFGDGPLQLMMAEQINTRMQKSFYTDSGAARLDKTYGLNKDQLGGLMMTAGMQGAFAGMHGGNADNAADRARVLADPATLAKMEKFLVSAAKATSGLMDVFGKLPIADILTKMQQITGLDMSKLGNMELAGKRMNALRTAAGATGMDVQSMFDTTAGARNLAVSMGFSQAGAGAMAGPAAINAAFRANENKVSAGHFFMSGPSVNELAASHVTNSAGMAQDPLGARRAAIMLMMQEGTISGAAATDLQGRMGKEGMTASHLDAEIQSRYKVNLSGYIRSMGGARGVYEQLDDTAKGNLQEVNQGDMNRRSEYHMRIMMRQQSDITGGNNQMLELMKNMSTDTLQDLLGKVDSGASYEDLIGSANKDMAGMEDPRKFVNLALAAKAGAGKGVNLQAKHLAMIHGMVRNPFTQNYQSRASMLDQAQLSRERDSIASPDGIRGANINTFVEGILQRQGGQDPGSVYAMLVADPFASKRIAGLSPDRQINLDPRRYRDPSTGMLNKEDWRKQLQILGLEFNKTEEGRGVLAQAGIVVNENSKINSVVASMTEQQVSSSYNFFTNEGQRRHWDPKFKLVHDGKGNEQFVVAGDYDIKRLGGGLGYAMGQVAQTWIDKKDTTTANAWKVMALELSTGREAAVDPYTGRTTIRNGKKLDPDVYKKLVADAPTFMAKKDTILDYMTPAQMQVIGRGNREAGMAISAELARITTENMGRTDAHGIKRTKQAKEGQEALDVIGIHATENQGVQQLSGVLKLVTDAPGVPGQGIDVSGVTMQPKK